jgi:hypothetical protein
LPSLFSTTLPPCGYDLQLAYQNVLHRLRRLYLLSPATARLHQIVNRAIFVTDDEVAPDTPPGAWCRKSVLASEDKWCCYFTREAVAQEQWKDMSAEEREKQRLVDKMYPIPRQLEIVLRDRRNTKGLHKLWAEWHEERRRGRIVRALRRLRRCRSRSRSRRMETRRCRRETRRR